MKRTLLAFFIGVLTAFSVNAQICTPDLSAAGDPGIHPDSVTNFADAYVGIPYAQTVTSVVPADTCAQILPLPFPCTTLSFDSVVVVSVSGLPTGFTFTCNPPGCKFLGNTIDCAIIEGTATAGQEGTYPLDIALNAYVGGTGIPNSFNLTYYRINVLSATSVSEEVAAKFEVAQNAPNPVVDVTTITYEKGIAGRVDLEVFNILGERVYSRSVVASPGANRVQLDAASWPNGNYIYKLSDGNTTISRRMMVSH